MLKDIYVILYYVQYVYYNPTVIVYHNTFMISRQQSNIITFILFRSYVQCIYILPSLHTGNSFNYLDHIP